MTFFIFHPFPELTYDTSAEVSLFRLPLKLSGYPEACRGVVGCLLQDKSGNPLFCYRNFWDFLKKIGKNV
jgi:hypothetical protein